MIFSSDFTVISFVWIPTRSSPYGVSYSVIPISHYEQEFTPFFTDDASVVEAMGVPVYLVEGNRENIKITTPFDLKVASALL